MSNKIYYVKCTTLEQRDNGYLSDHGDEVTRLRERVKELEAERRWIPVNKDTFIEGHDTRNSVLTWCPEYGIVQRRAYFGEWPQPVTHYMPLPNTPDRP
jgi:hypothetical protein